MNEKGSQNFIKLDRRILSHKVMKDPLAFQLFVYCILKAEYCQVDDEGVDVPRGSFMTTMKDIGADLKCSYKSVRKRLDKLSSGTSGADHGADLGADLLTKVRVGNRLMVTVVHYDKWQGILEDRGRPEGRPKRVKSSSLPLKKKKEKKEVQEIKWDTLD